MVFKVKGATYIYRPIDDFARVVFVLVFWVEGTTYVYQSTDGFKKVTYVWVFKVEHATYIYKTSNLKELEVFRFLVICQKWNNAIPWMIIYLFGSFAIRVVQNRN